MALLPDHLRSGPSPKPELLWKNEPVSGLNSEELGAAAGDFVVASLHESTEVEYWHYLAPFGSRPPATDLSHHAKEPRLESAMRWFDREAVFLGLEWGAMFTTVHTGNGFIRRELFGNERATRNGSFDTGLRGQVERHGYRISGARQAEAILGMAPRTLRAMRLPGSNDMIIEHGARQVTTHEEPRRIPLIGAEFGSVSMLSFDIDERGGKEPEIGHGTVADFMFKVVAGIYGTRASSEIRDWLNIESGIGVRWAPEQRKPWDPGKKSD